MRKDKNSNLWKKILLGMLLGILLGFIFNKETDLVPIEYSKFLIPWIALPGTLFLGLLQMIMVPLVLSSVALGIAKQNNQSQLGKITITSLFYFTSTTAIAISIGIVLTLWIQPGKKIDMSSIHDIEKSKVNLNLNSEDAEKTKNIPDLIMEIFPKNPLAVLEQASMLSIVIFALLLGLALSQLNLEQSKPLIDLLASVQDFTMVVVGWAISLAPVAVFGLMMQAVANIGLQLILGLSYYVVTVLMGLLSVLVFYLIIIYLVAGVRPFVYLLMLRELHLIAFSSASSGAVIPVSLKTAIEKLKVRESIADLIIPLGATINMDGTAIYQGIATIFLAQMFGVELDLFQLVTLVITVIGASIGTAGTPGVGIVILAGILTSVGVPTSGIAIIFGVDRFLDMCRTAINVTGDVTASKVMDRLFREI
ncbi:dicarboxylate/amino acid:cation symporter [Leptospira sp. GIMC2001]|uniref:dicarboxylate/amino acid:cation symporter n=1 Tax=Leptospira sp. GIMC2001 TaxID=1513297 RepID=UPI00234B5AB6|nr:dicarboxylate/amino acid:cation symporter [Leptospira sp. GIMC2001]WCL49558.1 dicarboxylate/amino acid:cation symporter [Leptospira sp. GIMC2001]